VAVEAKVGGRVGGGVGGYVWNVVWAEEGASDVPKVVKEATDDILVKRMWVCVGWVVNVG
jgi:hypothetical protein